MESILNYSSYHIFYENISSATTTPYQQVGIWVNIRQYNVWYLGYIGQKSAMISKHGFKAVPTVSHTIFGEIAKDNYIYPGPSQCHYVSCILINGALNRY